MFRFSATGIVRGVIVAATLMLGNAAGSAGQLVQPPLLGAGVAASEPTIPLVVTQRIARLSGRDGDTRATKGRTIGQLVGGLVGASAAGLGAFILLDDPSGTDRRVKGDAGYTPNANTAYAAGSFLGSTLAVYLIGRGDGSRGSMLATAIGTGIASIPLFLGRNEPHLPVFGILIGAPLQAVGGTIGYRRSRQELPAR